MAVVDSDEKFRLAASTWADANPGVFQGARFIDATARKIYDERPGGNVDVTPSQAVLEAALDTANTAVAQQQEIDAAKAALIAGKEYLKAQLVSVTPHNLTTLVNNIKPVVDGNTYLLRMVNNKIDVMSVAFVWTALSVKTPTAALDRSRYIEAVMQIIALLA